MSFVKEKKPRAALGEKAQGGKPEAPEKMTGSLWRRVIQWRVNAVNKVQATPPGRKRNEMAREFYDIDQSTMNDGIYKHGWPEMEPFLDDETDKKTQAEKRAGLIVPRTVCGKTTIYKKSWMPTLEEFRKENPFDQWDDLTKRSKNQDLKQK